MENSFKVVGSAITVSFLGIVLWSAHAVFILNNTAIYAENGVIENLQAVVLAISFVVYLAPIVLQKEPEKLILLFCSWLCCAFLLRELDVERLNVPDALKLVGSGAGRNIILGTGFMTLLLYAASKFSYYKKASIRFLRSRPGILLMVAGLSLVVGDVFEKTHSVYFEEIFELGGHALMLLSALAANLGMESKRGH